MSEETADIESREAFENELKALVDAAESGGVEIEGAYEVETTRDGYYDVEVTAVAPDWD